MSDHLRDKGHEDPADPAIGAPQSRARRIALLLFKVGVSGGLVIIVATKVDLASVSTRIAVLNLAWASSAVLLFLAQLVLSGYRWWEIAQRMGVPIRRMSAVRLVLIGHAFSQALPTAIGGDAVRAWLAARESGLLGRAISSVLCDREIALGVLLVIASIGQAILIVDGPRSGPLSSVRIFIWGATAALVFGIAVGPMLTAPLQRFRAGALLRRVLTDIRQVLGKPWKLAGKITGLSIAVQASIIVGTWFIARSLELPLTLGMCLIMLPPILVTAVLPISFGGWGVREGAMIVGLGMVGVSSDGALALSVLFGVFNLILAIPGVILWMIVRRKGDPLPRRRDRAVFQPAGEDRA